MSGSRSGVSTENQAKGESPEHHEHRQGLRRGPGFAAWLPADLPLVRATLAEVMELEE